METLQLVSFFMNISSYICTWKTAHVQFSKLHQILQIVRVVLQVIFTAEDACGDADDGDQADNDQKENYEQNHQPEVIFFISRIQGFG